MADFVPPASTHIEASQPPARVSRGLCVAGWSAHLSEELGGRGGCVPHDGTIRPHQQRHRRPAHQSVRPTRRLPRPLWPRHTSMVLSSVCASRAVLAVPSVRTHHARPQPRARLAAAPRPPGRGAFASRGSLSVRAGSNPRALSPYRSCSAHHDHSYPQPDAALFADTDDASATQWWMAGWTSPAWSPPVTKQPTTRWQRSSVCASSGRRVGFSKGWRRWWECVNVTERVGGALHGWVFLHRPSTSAVSPRTLSEGALKGQRGWCRG
jgi:hypothetical protein